MINIEVFGLQNLGDQPIDFEGLGYSSAYNHGSGEWAPPRLASLQYGHFMPFSISMIMGGRGNFIYNPEV